MRPIYWTLIGSLAGGYGLISIWSVLRARSIRAKRIRTDLGSFAKEFDGSRFPFAAIKAAYEDITNCVGHGVHADDHLEKTLGITPEDLEDLLTKRLTSMGISGEAAIQHTEYLPITTARDYARFLTFLQNLKEK